MADAALFTPVRRPAAALIHPEDAPCDRRWSLRASLSFAVASSAGLWAVIVWTTLQLV